MTTEAREAGEFGAIFDYVRAIPAGRVASYGDVGAAVGSTARTVGWALSMAPEDVPWQRVVGADGYLRIARRSPEFKAVQRTRLEAEGVRFQGECVAAEYFLSDGGAG